MDKVTANQTQQEKLGWTPADLGLAEWPPTPEDLVECITDLQKKLGLPDDGICGPLTLRAALTLRVARLREQPLELAQAGVIAVCQAKFAWLRSIIDLPDRSSVRFSACRDTIDSLIRTPDGINWSWEDPYAGSTSGHGNFEWCGAFAAHAWAAAGMRLPLRQKFFASTYRLDRWARYAVVDGVQLNSREFGVPPRMIIELDEHSTVSSAVFPDGSLPRAGDIALVGGVGTAYGKHITVIERYQLPSSAFVTLEGNGSGLLPSGARAHGIVRAIRDIGLPRTGARPSAYHVRRIIRPSIADLG